MCWHKLGHCKTRVYDALSVMKSDAIAVRQWSDVVVSPVRHFSALMPAVVACFVSIDGKDLWRYVHSLLHPNLLLLPRRCCLLLRRCSKLPRRCILLPRRCRKKSDGWWKEYIHATPILGCDVPLFCRTTIYLILFLPSAITSMMPTANGQWHKNTSPSFFCLVPEVFHVFLVGDMSAAHAFQVWCLELAIDESSEWLQGLCQGKECFGRSLDMLATNVGTPMWRTPPFQLFYENPLWRHDASQPLKNWKYTR